MGTLLIQIVVLLAIIFMIFIVMKVSGFISGKENLTKRENELLKKIKKEKPGEKTIQVNDWSIMELDEVGYPTSHMAELTFKDGKFTIGRDKHNDFVLDHRTVSGKHAVVLDTPKGLILKNEKSSANGVKHNGEAIEEIRLIDGMILQFGKAYCKFLLAGSQDGIMLDDGLNHEETLNNYVENSGKNDYIQRKL